MAQKQPWQSANMKKGGAAAGPSNMSGKINAASFHCSNNKVGKPTVKNYADGGAVEADDKQRGLEASSGEKVGLFERLRMGNIDDPNSEAYKRLGAGRGRQEREMDAAIKSFDGLPSVSGDGTKKAEPAPTGGADEKEPGWDSPAAAPARQVASKPAAKRGAIRRSAAPARPPLKSVMTDNSVRDAEMARLKRGGPKPTPRSVVFK